MDRNNKEEVIVKIGKYHNLRIDKFKFIKNGITIIVGENNVGKTNLLNYIYEKGGDWNGFNDDFHNSFYEKSEDETFYYKHLPLFFGNEEPIFSAPGEGNIKRWNIDYFYKLYYLDLKTFFDFLEKEVEEDEVPRKIKIKGCYLCYIESKDEEGKISKSAFLWGGKIEEQEKSWKIKYSGKVADVTTYRDKETGIITHGAFHESTNEYHDISKLGSGYLKIEKIKALINSLKSDNSEVYENKVYVPILLIDEPELLLHPPMIVEVSKLIKGLKEDNITTILTTHSPSLLSQFVCEEKIEIVLAKRDGRNKDLLGNIVYFWDVVKEIKEDIEKIWKSYCGCLEDQEEDEEFYLNYWKSLLNEYTLKIFFSEEIFFVEGMSDYILLTSEFLKRQIPELKKIEVIPIFGKSNYIFFKILAERLRLKFWFLLDMDKSKIDEKKFSERFYNKEDITLFVFESGGKNKFCESPELHTQFWYKHRGLLKSLVEAKEDKIANSGEESRISWFPEDMENFLLKEGNRDKYWRGKGKHRWSRKEAIIIGSISSEEFIEERFENLKKELRKIIRLIKEQKYREIFLPSAELKRLI